MIYNIFLMLNIKFIFFQFNIQLHMSVSKITNAVKGGTIKATLIGLKQNEITTKLKS